MKDTSDWYQLTIKNPDRYSVQASLRFEIFDDNGNPPKTLAKDAVFYLNPGTYFIRIYGVDRGGYKLTVAKETRHIVSMYEVKGSYPKYAFVNDGDTVPEPPDPFLHDGSYFHGWFLDVNNKYPYDFSKPVTNDLKLYAKWSMEPRLYAVVFESNGGDEVEHQMIARGGKPDRPADPTRAGYAFKGWYSDSKLTKAFDFNAPVKSDVTAYAKWEKLPSVFTVAFDANGGSVVASQKVTEGKVASKPADPTRTGYVFKGWFSDAKLTRAYDFSAAVKSDFTLYAKWVRVVRPSDQFTDVTGTSTWVINQGYLDYAVEHGLMTGYKTNGKLNGKFGPEDTLTRGQVAVVLYRVATGKDSGDGQTGFRDAGAYPYYRTAIKWLKDNGISTGDKDPATGAPLNTFRPDDPITRQELATLVYRFAKQQGVKTGTVSTGSLNKFKDGGAVLPYAREAVAWCNANGIVTGGQGADAGKVMPLNNATRAQAAKIFSVLHRDVLKG